MKVIAILQARTSSTRLPGKVLLKLNGKPMISWQIQRIKNSKRIDHLVVATSTDRTDDELVSVLQEYEVDVYRGSLKDVHSRFLNVVLKYPHADLIVRLTGDCPLVMPDLIDQMVNYFESNDFDYLSNCLTPSYPDGLDIEVFSAQSFFKLSSLSLSEKETEHVTLKYTDCKSGFKIGEFPSKIYLGNERWTVDYPEDFQFVKRVFNFFEGQESNFTIDDVLSFLETSPNSRNLLSHNLRNVSLN
jgi:spore coat polysaccharide biosynthesis protein SpsF (cytidylyltransferase family)